MVRASSGPKITPVMQQYLEIKRQHEDAVLFFRLGDFYEMFFDDAERAAGILDITLTSRNRNDEHPIPMCGVPYHSARGYIARLLEAGVKVAICEQIELPSRGIARREVARVITPGTALDEETLAPDRGNYLACIRRRGDAWGVAWVEFSTGEMRATELASITAVEEEIAALAPSEIVVVADALDAARRRFARALPGCLVTECVPGRAGDVARAGDHPPGAEAAIASLRAYLERTQAGHTEHLREPVYYASGAYLGLDRATRRNLELVETYDGERSGSLLGVVDRSVGAMGRRLAREWLLRPLADLAAIGERLDAVERLHEDFELRADLRELVARVGDLERLAGRIGSRTASPRDLVRLAHALEAVAGLKARLTGAELPSTIARARADLDDLAPLRDLLERALVDEPALIPGRGEIIRSGYHEEVDRLRGIRSDGKGWMVEFEAAERNRTGIQNLRVGYNKVFGYYIEVSRSAGARVPDGYARKQTLANAERFITDELKHREVEVLGAEERLTSLERHLFEELVERVAAEVLPLSRSAAAIGVLDALAGFAETAHQAGYVRPEMNEEGALEIVEGRHPVVETVLGNRFVPNDCRLAPDAELVIVITGPNMAGKSTYLRQVALIAVLAHAGSFVPAARARIPRMDRVFTRIGASDDLRRGQSTFMVEMSETAAILAESSERSLVVLDEIGRGTSTFDGISIAWAVAEAMVERGVRTLFATHYHELAGLAAEHEQVANYSVGVRRHKGEILFLYRVAPGAASGSFGIEVARLAGIPGPVIEKARQMLAKFEREPGPGSSGAAVQGNLFDVPERRGPEGEADELMARLAATETDRLSPLEALNLLDRLVREARERQQ